MNLLAVRYPWPELVRQRKKTMELRSQATKIRGDIAIYGSRTKPIQEDLDYVNHVLGISIDPDIYDYGKIVAIADLVDCVSLDTPEKYYSYQLQHCGLPSGWKPGLYGWLLDNIRPLFNPVDYKMPKGAVVWSKIPDGLVEV